ETVARNVSPWVRTSKSTQDLCKDAAEAIGVCQGPPGQVATLILPADVSWGEGGVPAAPPKINPPKPADDATVAAIAQALQSGGKKAILLGARALREPALMAVARIAAKTGAKLFAEVFPTRIERGAGLPPVERIAYLAELASVQLSGLDHLILVDAKAPVSFFAYPGKKSYLVPEGCQLHTLAAFTQDVIGSLDKLAKAVNAGQTKPVLQAPRRPGRPRGKFTADKVCKAIGQLMPDNAILVDEAQTSGIMLPMYTAGAPRHDVITLTGGAIGQGLPNAVGAAIACPDRKVIALAGDGSAMYTLQALWTQAREKLDVINIIFNNRSYAILNVELRRVGASGAGDKAKAQLDLRTPPIDFVQLAQGMGVAAKRATTTDEFLAAFEHALRTPGPHLIEAIVPPSLTGLKLRVLPHLLQSLANLPPPIARALKRKIAP
ncbi:MAG: hypothetical protein RL710_3336, partial [Pseudomonadota bacterium]